MSAALAEPGTTRTAARTPPHPEPGPRSAPAVAPRMDARRVVIRPAPIREPPFDDELPVIRPPGPLDRQLPFESPARPRVWRPGPPTRRRLPAPGPWACRLLIGMIESANGRRPLHQISGLLSPSVGRGLGADFDRAAQSGVPHWLHRATIRTVRVSEPADGVAELAIAVDVGGRVRAVAVRLEEHHGRWRCTRLQLG